jgi:hypothetical protein
MPTLIVDGQRALIESTPKTLGELLAQADARCAPHGRIVTAVRIDGVDEPAFRELDVLHRPLKSMRRIEIESGTHADLARRCLGEAGIALEALADGSLSVATRLREGQVLEGNAGLATISQGIGTVLAITGAASLGLGMDVAAIETTEGTLASVARETARHLETLITAQLAADWPAVADRLEQDLSPALSRWGRMCRTLRIASGPALPLHSPGRPQ